ncbi:MAG TPA: hypothetical protein VHO84_03650 [Syntrophorhabdaceae bacterium]|nr:hypothetical protein [Syntrophorhabdaceae bacterium]
MAKTSAAKKSETSKRKEKTKSEDRVEYVCDVCGRVVYMDMFGDYEEEDLICCGEFMTERED